MSPFYLRQLSCHDYFRGRRLPTATMWFTKTALIKIEAGLETVRSRGQHTDLELQFGMENSFGSFQLFLCLL